jgi:D-xylose transport system substrate-binding protein
MGISGSRVVVVSAALALVTGVAACGGGDDSGGGGGGGGGDQKGAKIALLLPETKTTRYEQQDRPRFTAAVKEQCPSCQVIYANADQDPAKQQQQAEAAITQGAKAIVISAVDVKSAAAIATRARQSKIPVISYGRLVANAPLDAYVSIDPFKVGQQQGRALLSALKANGKSTPSVVMINGSPSDSNAGPYKKGAHSVLDPAGVKVVKEFDTPDWSPDAAQREMEQAITSVGKSGFDGVYVANDGMAGGAIAAMKGAGIDPSTRPVTGQDAELAGVQRILAGEQLMTVYQPIPQLAVTAAKVAVAEATGKQPPAGMLPEKVDNGGGQVPSALLDTIAITKDNIADTVVKDGFLKASAICTGTFAQPCRKAGIE